MRYSPDIKPDNLTGSIYELSERYADEAAAIAYFEKARWPNGVYCPHCGDTHVRRGMTARRRQIWHCSGSHQFSVTTGTVMEDTKLPLRKWLFAFHILGGSKKGVSAKYIARALSVSYRTAWHLCHRIRATMVSGQPLLSGTVESDEAYIGGRRKHVGHGYKKNKIAVQTIVERSNSGHNGRGQKLGRAKTIALDPDAEKVDGRTVGAKLREHTIPPRTHLMTDESPIYEKVGEKFKTHDTVNHKKEDYAHTDPLSGRLVTTNTAEGLFANLKRQITGTHHSTSKRHLPRYLEEYDFKYNTRDQTDGERTLKAIQNMEGKKLTLFKGTSGNKSTSLIDENERSHTGLKRGRHKKVSTSKKRSKSRKSSSKKRRLK